MGNGIMPVKLKSMDNPLITPRVSSILKYFYRGILFTVSLCGGYLIADELSMNITAFSAERLFRMFIALAALMYVAYVVTYKYEDKGKNLFTVALEVFTLCILPFASGSLVFVFWR